MAMEVKFQALSLHRTRKLQAEVANGRLAMMAIIGMFLGFAGLTSSLHGVRLWLRGSSRMA